ncbi:hypothetical protein D3C85_1533670 [compost metagenome]
MACSCSSRSVASEDVCRQRIWQRVRSLNHLFESVEHGQGSQRAKRLIDHYQCIIRDVTHYRWGKEETFTLQPASPSEHFGAFRDCIGHQSIHVIQAAFGDQWAHYYALLQTVPDDQAFGTFQKTRNELLID